jgi:Na+/melibiose symporter-like transporter
MNSTFTTRATRLLVVAQLIALVTATNGKTLGIAFGVTAAVGILCIIFLVLCIRWLRRRHKQRVANGEEGQEELEGYCVCTNCSGCTKRKGGGDGSAACASCRDVCMR